MKLHTAVGILVLALLINNQGIAKKLTSYDDLDITSTPKKILSQKDTQLLWSHLK